MVCNSHHAAFTSWNAFRRKFAADNSSRAVVTVIPVLTAKIRVTVIHGDLAFAHFSVLARDYEVGTFAGAEPRLDHALGFRLTERRRLGLPGQIGATTVVLDPAARPSGAVVVGLGQSGTLAAGQLRRTLRQSSSSSTRTYVGE